MTRQGCFLTEQEVERIVTLLADSDMTILEIAQRMTCSPSTIAAVNRRFQVRKYAGLKAKWILELKPDFPDEKGTGHFSPASCFKTKHFWREE
jgi:hypothetical protein